MKTYTVEALDKEGKEYKFEIQADNIKMAYFSFNIDYPQYEISNIYEKIEPYEPSDFISYFL